MSEEAKQCRRESAGAKRKRQERTGAPSQQWGHSSSQHRPQWIPFSDHDNINISDYKFTKQMGSIKTEKKRLSEAFSVEK